MKDEYYSDPQTLLLLFTSLNSVETSIRELEDILSLREKDDDTLFSSDGTKYITRRLSRLKDTRSSLQESINILTSKDSHEEQES